MLKKQYIAKCNVISFLTSFITLATQILVFRIISAKLFNNFAFLVISLTMLGFAIAGVILAFNSKFIRKIRRYVYQCMYSFIFTLLFNTFLFYRLSLAWSSINNKIEYFNFFLVCISLASLFVIPFIFCGLILGILLAHKQLPTKRIYCFDLLGSALGALLIVFFISFLGVEQSLLILCGLFLLGVNIILPLRSKKNGLAFGFFLLLLLVLYPNSSTMFKMQFPGGSLLQIQGTEYFKWDPIARIDVSSLDVQTLDHGNLSMLGSSHEFHQHIKKNLCQNNNAATWAFLYDGHPESLKGIEDTLYYGAYKATLVAHPNVLVIGVGAGMDILSAIYANAVKITGVEINGATHKILKDVYKDYFKHWVNDPRLRLVHDEGRHYLSTSSEKYDVIQLTGVDSYTGTMASTNIFSENYLYTKEAIRLYFTKLKEDGVINLIRLEYPEAPREMLRMLVTTVQVLREMGIQEPSQHIAMLSDVWLTATSLLIQKKPFTQDQIQKLKRWALDNPYFYYSTTPELSLSVFRVYQSFLELNNESLEKVFIKQYPYNIQPTEDDQPFFYHYTKWADLFRNGIPVLEYNIVLLLSFLAMISGIFILLPLRILFKISMPLLKKRNYRWIFSCLGLGYFFIEIAFMQKLGLFLGHPNHAVSIVLSGLLLSTGLGSVYSGRIIQKLKNIRYVTYCLSTLILLEMIFILPYLNLLISQSMFFKAIFAFLLLFPVGLLLGVYLPQAVNNLKRVSPQYVPWGWGINGFFSVISPIVAMAISVTFGISFLLLCSIPIYFVAGYLLGLEKC